MVRAVLKSTSLYLILDLFDFLFSFFLFFFLPVLPSLFLLLYSIQLCKSCVLPNLASHLFVSDTRAFLHHPHFAVMHVLTQCNHSDSVTPKNITNTDKGLDFS